HNEHKEGTTDTKTINIKGYLRCALSVFLVFVVFQNTFETASFNLRLNQTSNARSIFLNPILKP
ncbi:MAG: hypothetical protein ACT4OJ_07830, partial [Bacteroidota bacterium]